MRDPYTLPGDPSLPPGVSISDIDGPDEEPCGMSDRQLDAARDALQELPDLEDWEIEQLMEAFNRNEPAPPEIAWKVREWYRGHLSK